jgi:hypothetical protein
MHTLAPARLVCSLLTATAAAGLIATTASAQCSQWQTTLGVAGVEGDIHAVCEWDPDGAGPQPWGWVVGGSFTLAGTAVVRNLAMYTPSTGQWRDVGGGCAGPVYALCVRPTGQLVVGGDFTTVGAIPCNRIAQWNGTAWSGFVSGGLNGVTGGSVNALAVNAAGTVYVGGAFTSAGATFATGLAAWNGGWTAPASLAGGPVRALACHPNGEVLVGGSFTSTSGTPTPGIVRLTGSTFATALTGVAGGTATVHALAVAPSGVVYVGGDFTTFGGLTVNNLGTLTYGFLPQVGAVGTGVGGPVRGIVVDATSVGVVGGFLSAGGVAASGLARYTAGGGWTQWTSCDNASGTCLARRASGECAVGGTSFLGAVNGFPVNGFAVSNGVSWGPAGSSTNGAIEAMAWMPNGDLVVGGTFNRIGGVTCVRIARFNGVTWSPLGSGVNVTGVVHALLVLPNGDLIAGGSFTQVGGISAVSVARWNGTSWSALGSGVNGEALALARLPNGDLVVGGTFSSASGVSTPDHVARWNGTSWSAFGATAIGTAVNALAVLPSGELVAGSANTSLLAVRRWDGAAWQPFGTGFNSASVNALQVMPNGDLVATGSFQTLNGQPYFLNGIARWNGAWQALDTGLTFPPGSGSGGGRALALLPTGELVVGGRFTGAGGVACNGIARWNGTAWSTLGSGVDAGAAINALRMAPDGLLVAGGTFTAVDGVGSKSLAYLQSTCPATSTIVGTTCISPTNAATYLPQSQPWIGTSMRVRATGVPAASIGAWVVGFATVNLPLAALLPPSPANCSLLVQPDIVNVVLPAAGVIETALPIPLSPAYIGLVVHQQLGVLELGPSGFTRNSTTNAVSATVGSF